MYAQFAFVQWNIRDCMSKLIVSYTVVNIDGSGTSFYFATVESGRTYRTVTDIVQVQRV
jgi:hypothetical protein